MEKRGSGGKSEHPPEGKTKAEIRSRNIIRDRFNRLRHPVMWSQVKAEIGPSTALLPQDKLYYEKLDDKLNDKNIHKSFEEHIQSLAEGIKTQLRCEQQIASARINELLQVYKLKDDRNTEQSKFKIIAKILTYRILQYSVGGLDVYKRKEINSNLDKHAKHVENVKKEDYLDSEHIWTYSVSKFEMPSFYHMTLNNLKELARELRKDKNDISPVTPDEIKNAGKNLKKYIQTLLERREKEQGCLAQIALSQRKIDSLSAKETEKSSEMVRLEFQRNEYVKNYKKEFVEKHDNLQNNDKFDVLIAKLVEQQKNRGDQLIPESRWTGITNKFEYAYRRKTGVGRPLDLIAASIKNYKYLNKLEPLVRTRARALATSPVTVPLVVGALSLIAAGTAYSYRKEIGSFTKRQALKAYNKIELGGLHIQEKYHTVKQERQAIINYLQEKMLEYAEKAKELGNNKENIIKEETNRITRKNKILQDKQSMTNDIEIKNIEKTIKTLKIDRQTLKNERDQLYRECKQLVGKFIMRHIGLKSRAKMPEKSSASIVESDPTREVKSQAGWRMLESKTREKNTITTPESNGMTDADFPGSFSEIKHESQPEVKHDENKESKEKLSNDVKNYLKNIRL